MPKVGLERPRVVPLLARSMSASSCNVSVLTNGPHISHRTNSPAIFSRKTGIMTTSPRDFRSNARENGHVRNVETVRSYQNARQRRAFPQERAYQLVRS